MKLIQLIQIQDLNSNIGDYSDLEYKINLVAIYLDKDLEFVWSLKVDQLLEHFEKCCLELSDTTILQHFELDGTTFHRVELDYLTVGEYIALDHLFNGDIIDNSTRIISILYRRLIEAETKWIPAVIEEFDGRVSEHRHLNFLEVDSRVINSISWYSKWRKNLVMNYSSLFKAPELKELEEGLSESDKSFIKRAEEEEQRQLRWGWEYSISLLTGGNHNLFFDILEKPIIWFFNQLSFIKDRNV